MNPTTIITTESTTLKNTQIVLQLLGTPVVGSTGPVGPQGDTGPVGPPAEYTNKITSSTVSGHRIVMSTESDEIALADNRYQDNSWRILGITTEAANIGTSVNIQVTGYLTDPSFTFSPGPIFLGINGTMVQVPPLSPAVFSIVIGYAISNTEIYINKQIPIFIG